MSIYAEVNEKYNEISSGVPDNDRNVIAEIVGELPPDMQLLWKRETRFALELRCKYKGDSNFGPSCEREIMRKFAKEEAARFA